MNHPIKNGLGAPSIVLSKTYFPALDVLRFFAFLIVFLFHIPSPNSDHWYENIRPSGTLGVNFFFVLSSFFISSILFKEKRNTGKINFKNFYFRRVLRIWPLYYFFISLGFIIIYVLELLKFKYAGTGYDPDWRYSYFFLENYKTWLEGASPKQGYFMVLWTVCLEEQFYVLWPVIIYFVPKRKFLLWCVIFIFLSLVVKIFYNQFGVGVIDVFVVLDLFAIGALLAFFYVNNPEKVNYLLQNITYKHKIGLTFFVISLVFLMPHISLRLPFSTFIEHILFSLLCILIILISLPLESNNLLTNKMLVYCGRISFGLYLYHSLIIRIVFHIWEKIFPYDNSFNFIGFVFSSLFFTLVVSHLSYKYFESYFLNLKNRFV